MRKLQGKYQENSRNGTSNESNNIFPTYLEGISSEILNCIKSLSPEYQACPINVILNLSKKQGCSLDNIESAEQCLTKVKKFTRDNSKLHKDFSVLGQRSLYGNSKRGNYNSTVIFKKLFEENRINHSNDPMTLAGLFKREENQQINSAKHSLGLEVLRKNGAKILDPTQILATISSIDSDEKQTIILASKILNVIYEAETYFDSEIDPANKYVHEKELDEVSRLIAFKGESLNGSGILFNQMASTISNLVQFFNTRLVWSYLNTSNIFVSKETVSNYFQNRIELGIVSREYGDIIINFNLSLEKFNKQDYSNIQITSDQKTILYNISELTIEYAKNYYIDLVTRIQLGKNVFTHGASNEFITYHNIRQNLIKYFGAKCNIYLMLHGLCGSDLINLNNNKKIPGTFEEHILESSKTEIGNLVNRINLKNKNINNIYSSIYPRALQTLNTLRKSLGQESEIIFHPGITNFDKNSTPYSNFKKYLENKLPTNLEQESAYILHEGIMHSTKFITSLLLNPFNATHLIVTHSSKASIMHNIIHKQLMTDNINHGENNKSIHKHNSISHYQIVGGNLVSEHLNLTEPLDDME